MNAAKRKALDAMATGAPLYVYVEPIPHQLILTNYPIVGSGVILADDGPLSVSSRIVSAIKNLGTRWCDKHQAVVLTEVARLRVLGWYKADADTWLPD